MTDAKLLGEYKLIRNPLWWHKGGRKQTVSGYGSKIVSELMVEFPNGKRRRVYFICYSNAGSPYVIMNKKRVFIDSSMSVPA